MSATPYKQPEHQDIWRGTYRDVPYKISLHAKGAKYTPASQGIWCFYLYLHEPRVVNFEAIWLPEKRVQISPESPERISHDYMACEPLSKIELHSGATYYAKHGHAVGHRCVEVGCDYNHLWDMERGGGFTVEEVFHDVREAINSAYTEGLLATRAAGKQGAAS